MTCQTTQGLRIVLVRDLGDQTGDFIFNAFATVKSLLSMSTKSHMYLIRIEMFVLLLKTLLQNHLLLEALDGGAFDVSNL